MRQTLRRPARSVAGLVVAGLALGLVGCTQDDEDTSPQGGPASASTTPPAETAEEAAGPLAFTAEESRRRNCATLGGARGSFVIWARVAATEPVRLGTVQPTGQGALPTASLTLRTFVADDPGPQAPDFSLSRDGVPGTPVSDPASSPPAIGGDVDDAGREAAARAWSERRPARGVELEPGSHYVFVTLDAVKGFELGPPELTWSQPDDAGRARLRWPLFGRVRCGG